MRSKENKPDGKIIAITPRLGVSLQELRNPGELFATQLYGPEYFDRMIEIGEDGRAKGFGH